MANHLDLEEQEQLAELKHFWKRYGNIISWVLIVVFGAVAVWNGYQYWQRSQAAQAAVMYDEVERAAVAGDVAKLERALGDMKERFGRTAYAEQAALLAARIYHDKGNLDAAKGALAADRRGDILLAQSKKAEAKAQYEAAYKGLDERSDYRRIIEVKLNALGVDPVVKVAAPAAAASETAK